MEDDTIENLKEKLNELKSFLDDEIYRLNLSNLETSFSILENAKKKLKETPDDAELQKIVAELSELATGAMEEISDETMNDILDLHNKRVDDYNNRLKQE